MDKLKDITKLFIRVLSIICIGILTIPIVIVSCVITIYKIIKGDQDEEDK